MLVLGGISLYLALVGKIDSMPHVQQALLAADCKALRQSLKQVGQGALFRGGQRPYSPGKSCLPDALLSFYNSLGTDIHPLMNDLRRLRSSTSRAPLVYDLVERVANDTSIKCFLWPLLQDAFLGSSLLDGWHPTWRLQLGRCRARFRSCCFPDCRQQRTRLETNISSCQKRCSAKTRHSKPMSFHGCEWQNNQLL